MGKAAVQRGMETHFAINLAMVKLTAPGSRWAAEQMDTALIDRASFFCCQVQLGLYVSKMISSFPVPSISGSIPGLELRFNASLQCQDCGFK